MAYLRTITRKCQCAAQATVELFNRQNASQGVLPQVRKNRLASPPGSRNPELYGKDNIIVIRNGARGGK